MISPVTWIKAPRRGVEVFCQRGVFGKRQVTVNAIDFRMASHTYVLTSIDRNGMLFVALLAWPTMPVKLACIGVGAAGQLSK